MARLGRLRDEAAMGLRLLRGLPRFFGAPLTRAECRTRIETSLAARETRFLGLLRRGVYERPGSPYLPLLRDAGVSFADAEALVRREGIEGALARLYDAGVRVTLDEFKGRRPIRQARPDAPQSARAFDNPLLLAHYEMRSSGSRGPRRRFRVDLDMLEHEACYERLFIDDFGLADRPHVLWRVVPPGGSGVKAALRLARLGERVDRWFSQTPVSWRADPGNALFLHVLRASARWFNRPLPRPEHVGLENAVLVARWLAGHRAAGTPAFFATTSSCAVRVCAAAAEHGLDIRDTFIRAGGEPLSPGKMKVVTAAGCTAQTHFGMAEVGRMALACRFAEAPDDVHLMRDKVAVVQREAGSARVPGLWLTTLHWSAPKIMINVELGDYGILAHRQCGCVWDSLGFTEHLSAIRSYEKLTTEGMHFMGTDLIALAEDVLPARFGGTATDYQFVEDEDGGLTRVSLVISPRVGAVDEAAVVQVALETLGRRDGAHRMMTAIWRDGGTLRVLRREPFATSTGKIQTLHGGNGHEGTADGVAR
jgi:hypothetical protein